MKLAARRSSKRKAPPEQEAEPHEDDDPVGLQTVKEIYGVGYCRRRDLSPYERRNGRDTNDNEVAFLARGRIGEDGNDDRGSDTRWVWLADLVQVDNIEDSDLDGVLDEFFDALKDDVKVAVERLRKERDA